jgi:hypothetical protein
MFENELIWEAYILERQDREKISQANNIYQNYYIQLKEPLDQYIRFLKSLDSSDGVITIDKSDKDLKLKASNEYDTMRNLKFHTMTPELRIEFSSDENSKRGSFEIKTHRYTKEDMNFITINSSGLNFYLQNIKDCISEINHFYFGGGNYLKIINRLIASVENFFEGLDNFKDTIIHEIIHFFDRDYMSKHNKNSKSYGASDNEYYNDIFEVNAHLLQRLFKYGNIESMEEFIQHIKNDQEFDWLGNLNEKNKRKVLKRIYDYYKNR